MMNADENISLMILSVLIACSVMLLKIAGISPIKILYHCIKTMTYLVVLSILVILMYFTGLHLGSMLNIDPLVTKVGVICLIRSIMLNAIRSCGIPISNKESTKKITELFVRLMEMKDKPHYDGVMEHLMERNLRDD